MKKRIAFLLAVTMVLTLGGIPFPVVGEGALVIGENGMQELTPDGAIRIRGDYIIDSPRAVSFSDERIIDGTNPLYLTEKDDGAPSVPWYFPIGTHVPLTAIVSFTNMSAEKTSLLKRVRCQIVYDNKYVFDTTPMQVNPDQKAANGNTGYPSTDAVPLEPLVGTLLYFRANVPLIVRDSDAPLVAYMTLDDSANYTINLRDIVEVR